jgi:hypothetical protein
MLTVSTPIPTSLRGKIRALVKAHANWHGFLTEKQIISASARNADLIEFALRHPTLAAWIEQLLADYAAAAPKESAATLMLARRVEALLQAYTAKTAQKPRIRVKAVTCEASPEAAEGSRRSEKDIEDQLNDFNWVGSRHHY